MGDPNSVLATEDLIYPEFETLRVALAVGGSDGLAPGSDLPNGGFLQLFSDIFSGDIRTKRVGGELHSVWPYSSSVNS